MQNSMVKIPVLVSFFIFIFVLLFSSCSSSKKLLDHRDGQKYRTVKLGDQTWMAENLNFLAGPGSRCFDNKDKNCRIYGKLYNWEAAKTACPDGWNLPDSTDWLLVKNKFEGQGRKMKIRSIYGRRPYIRRINGFNALPAGYYDDKNEFSPRINGGYFWSSSSTDSGKVKVSHIVFYFWGGHNLGLFEGDISGGKSFSIRCIKDY